MSFNWLFELHFFSTSFVFPFMGLFLVVKLSVVGNVLSHEKSNSINRYNFMIKDLDSFWKHNFTPTEMVEIRKLKLMECH